MPLAVSLAVPLAGVDFHFCGWLLDAARRRALAQGSAGGGALAAATEDDLQRAMWHWRSGVNRRRLIGPRDLAALRDAADVTACSAAIGARRERNRAAREETRQAWEELRESVDAVSRTFLAARMDSDCQHWV